MREDNRQTLIFCFVAISCMWITHKAIAADYIDILIQREHIISKDITHKIFRYDLSKLWTTTSNEDVLGYIGNNYQRFRIKFVTICRDSTDSMNYILYGKDRVEDNICSFHGSIKIDKAYYTENMAGGDQRTGIVTGWYLLKEDTVNQHSGVLHGRFITYWYIDTHNKLHYNDLLMGGADGYCNNQFLGTWISNKDKRVLKCNWGDYRIPDGYKMDCGAGEFGVDEKYVNNGWKNFQDAQRERYNNNKGVATEREMEEWWK